MILSTHYMAGMAVAGQTESWLLMPIASLVSHFLLDRIPHWEYLDTTKQIKSHFHLVLIDLFAPAIFFLFLFSKGFLNLQDLLWLNLGGFFGILPDGLVFLKHITKSKNIWLKKFFNFHRNNHTLIDLPRFWGIITQGTIISLCLYLIFIAKIGRAHV